MKGKFSLCTNWDIAKMKKRNVSMRNLAFTEEETTDIKSCSACEWIIKTSDQQLSPDSFSFVQSFPIICTTVWSFQVLRFFNNGVN